MDRFRSAENGTVLNGRYRLTGKLGSGGMGAVYAAEDLQLYGKLRAVKLTVSAGGGEERSEGRMTEEAALLTRLSHPNLPQIIDRFTVAALHADALVMDYIYGEDLSGRFARFGKRLPFHEVLQTALQLCSALDYLHRQTPRIIHRDLKPSNVMIEEGGHIRLIDFGIARQYKLGYGEDTELLGTPGFAAPEQASGDMQSGPCTDIYGLGALLFYLLSGGRYYRSDIILRGDPMHALQEDTPPVFKTLLGKMLQERPGNRWASMAALESELERLARNESVNRPLVHTVHREPARKRPQVSFLSLSPGAGSTFVAITAAKLLAESGVACAAAEIPSSRPEWQILLNGTASSLQRNEMPFDSWSSGGLHCFAPPYTNTGMANDSLEKLKVLLGQAPGRTALLDMGNALEQDECWPWLLQSQTVFAVADPYPSKLRTERLDKLEKLSWELESNGGKLYWIANKAVPFKRQADWLTMFGKPPLAAIPQLPAEKWLTQLWRGKWATDDRTLKGQLDKAMHPILREIRRGLDTK
ncbi:serine/threonine protein kinase [Paenibacillus sp. NPDC058071]|uniref:serine/threonine protein kinase n=1 Tax=Paenibacillus sp. NPDC058071 TaxID=3346326 RepID=UPI0036DD3757